MRLAREASPAKLYLTHTPGIASHPFPSLLSYTSPSHTHNALIMPPPAEDVRNGRKAQLGAHDNGLWETAQRIWRKSHASDYLGLLIIAVVLLFIRTLGEPYHQMFALDDLRLQHPHADPERVDVCMFVTVSYYCSHSGIGSLVGMVGMT